MGGIAVLHARRQQAPATRPCSDGSAPLPCPAAGVAAHPFVVRGHSILDPHGHPFVIRGITALYGTFAGGDERGYGEINYQHARHDLALFKRMGSIWYVFSLPHPMTIAYHKARIHAVVTWARREGLVVYLANSYSTAAASLPWLRYLARTYKEDPYVWLQPMNEPNCAGAQYAASRCHNWPFWQGEEQRYIMAIRAAGMRSPIVVNAPAFSWDLSRIDRYPLHDRAIVYGVHRYGNDDRTFSAAQQADSDGSWANLSATHAIIVDEVGDFNGLGRRNSPHWLEGFIRYAANWVNRRGGDGLIAFTWYWPDPNGMSNANGSLRPWGRVFYKLYLQRIGGANTPAGRVGRTWGTAAEWPRAAPPRGKIRLANERLRGRRKASLRKLTLV